MNRKCWRLQSHDMWLGLKIDKLFTTRKEADHFYHIHCMGCGIITRVRAIDEKRRYYPSIDVLPTTTVKILGVNEK